MRWLRNLYEDDPDIIVKLSAAGKFDDLFEGGRSGVAALRRRVGTDATVRDIYFALAGGINLGNDGQVRLEKRGTPVVKFVGLAHAAGHILQLVNLVLTDVHALNLDALAFKRDRLMRRKTRADNQ